ncbi:minichromosome maintenance protein MCM [Candidatus Bathyarchaeota archaeon]|nr:minichromosome maintenance protein MCM [Candidatus Bathyarchaeota archaeon]
MTEAKTLNPMEQFQNFLGSFTTEDGVFKYRQRLSQMAVSGAKFLMVDFGELMTYNSELARGIIDTPDDVMNYINDAAWAQLKIEAPDYSEKVGKVTVRFRDLPDTIQMRSIGSDNMGKLIMVDGILVRASTIQPLIVKAVFKCRKCEHEFSVEQKGTFLETPICPDCKRIGSCDLLERKSEFMDSQEIRIQEKPEDLPPGQLPRWLDVKLFDDLVDIARPGDRVSTTGMVRAVQVYGRSKLRTFNLYIEGNFVNVSGKEYEVVQISPEEERKIIELSKDPLIHTKLISSVAPSIYGYDHLKEAILYLLFSGVQKLLPDGIRIRGDINVLFIGDPGTAKSQMLQYVSKVAPRGLYTSGRGSTAAGLTAAVLQDKGGGMTLEAGALVLADKGVCCIDEIDKMRKEDRVAIHEAMEQQTVSIAKGGIVATLNARSSILAAGNPTLGRYDAYRTIAENVQLPVTILSRFDLIFIIRDEPEPKMDERMAEHILTIHKTGTTPVQPPITPDMLRKYIGYAKQINPVLSEEAVQRLQEFYLRMRSASESSDSPIAITPRQLESLIRLAEARARVALREKITIEDAQTAILLMKTSLDQVGIDTASGRYDIDVIMTGKSKSVRDKLQIVLSTIIEMEKLTGSVKGEELFERLEKEYDLNPAEARRLVGQLAKDGTIYSPRSGEYKRT